MSHLEAGFIRLPPDSTGKKSAAAGRLIIDFEGEVDPNILEVGDTITGGTSSAVGTIVGISRAGFAAGQGQLFVEVSTLTGSFTISEALKIGAITYATVTASASLDTIYYQKSITIDQDNPNRHQKINERGAASITFSEGQPSLSSFGGLIVDEPTSVRQYVYAYDDLSTRFVSDSGGAGTIVYNPDERAVTLDTNGTASGDFASRQSHFYHPYQAGTMMRVLQSMVCGDAGKDDVRRRWGLFDSGNGLFWEQDGSGLYCVVRSSTTGSVVDTRVAQADWNADPLDGTINFNLDVTKANLYWIDVQWLGVGVVRFGVYEDDGTKTIAHIFQNPNNNTTSYMRQGTLPIRFECENTNTAVSSSELKNICTAVQNIGRTKNQLQSRAACTTSPKTVGAASGEVPTLSLRPRETFNGLPNRTTSLLESVNVYNPSAENVLVRLKRGTIPSGDAFNTTITNSGSPIEIDEAALGLIFQGEEIWATFLPSGESVIYNFLNEAEELQDDVGIVYLGDQVTQPSLSITATVIGGSDTDLSVAVNWKEIIQ